MSRAVFDASAMLALIQSERGADKLTDEIRDSAVASRSIWPRCSENWF